MPDTDRRPGWVQLHQAATGLLDVLTRLSLALKAKDNVKGQQVYAELLPATEAMRQLAYPMEKALRENFGTISDGERTAGAYLARVINGASDALVALSGFGGGASEINKWYADLRTFVKCTATLAKSEVESN